MTVINDFKDLRDDGLQLTEQGEDNRRSLKRMTFQAFHDIVDEIDTNGRDNITPRHIVIFEAVVVLFEAALPHPWY